MGWLIALSVLIIIGLLPLGVCGSYDDRGALIYLYVGPVRIALYPRKKAGKEKKEQPGSAEKTANVGNSIKNSGGKLADFIPLVKTVFAFFGELVKKIKVRDLEIKVTLAGSDPCDLSVNYGRTCAALGNLQPHINRLFCIKKQNISVECDYTAEESVVTACLDITICLARFLALVIRYGIQAIKQYFTIYNKRKGGAQL